MANVNRAPIATTPEVGGLGVSSPLSVADRLASVALEQGIMLAGHVQMPRAKEDGSGRVGNVLKPVGVGSRVNEGVDVAVSAARDQGITSETAPGSPEALGYQRYVADAVNSKKAKEMGDEKGSRYAQKARVMLDAEQALRGGSSVAETMRALRSAKSAGVELPPEIDAQVSEYFTPNFD